MRLHQPSAVKPATVVTNTSSVPLAGLELPVDPALPGYPFLSEPERLKAALSRAMQEWLGPERYLIDVRAYLRRLFTGKRCSFELELEIGRSDGTAQRYRMFAKLYREDEATTVYDTLKKLRRRGFAAGRFLVPQPIALIPEHRFLLLSWADGELLSSLVLARPDPAQQVAGAAEWLLQLHECGMAEGRRYSFSVHLRTLARWKEVLIEVDPQSEPLLSGLLGRMEERGRQLAECAARPTHRDFSPEHIVVDVDQFTCVDFDEFCQYDPLFDVAHFIAHLRFLGLSSFAKLDHFDWLAYRFLAGYESGAATVCEKRLRLYMAIAYLKLGRFVALVQRPEGWKQMLPELLTEACRFV